MDEYLEGVRSIERQIEKAEQFPTPQAPIGTPPGIPPDHKLHVDLMYDLMALAFQTDSTRVVSYLRGAGGQQSAVPGAGHFRGPPLPDASRVDEEKILKVAQDREMVHGAVRPLPPHDSTR